MSKYVWKDMGWQALKGKISRLSGVSAKVGLVGTSGGAVHRGSSGDLTNAEVGAIMEFGSGSVPARPFMAPTLAENRMAYMNLAKAALKQFVFGGATADSVMGRLGQWLADKMKAKVLSNVPPPLAPATVEKKGHADSLIDSDQMYDAITYELVHGAITEFLSSEPDYGNAVSVINTQLRGYMGE